MMWLSLTNACRRMDIQTADFHTSTKRSNFLLTVEGRFIEGTEHSDVGWSTRGEQDGRTNSKIYDRDEERGRSHGKDRRETRRDGAFRCRLVHERGTRWQNRPQNPRQGDGERAEVTAKTTGRRGGTE